MVEGTVEIVPQKFHRLNTEEVHACVSKHNPIAMLSTCHKARSSQFWYYLLDQVKVTLNILRTFILYPQLSACK